MGLRKYNLKKYISDDKRNIVIDLFFLNYAEVNIDFVSNLYSIIFENKGKYNIKIIISKKYKFDRNVVIIKNDRFSKLNIFFYNLQQFIFDLGQTNAKIIYKWCLK